MRDWYHSLRIVYLNVGLNRYESFTEWTYSFNEQISHSYRSLRSLNSMLCILVSRLGYDAKQNVRWFIGHTPDF